MTPSEPSNHPRRETADLCPFGCYWECEHRSSLVNEGSSPLHPVHDDAGRALNRCRECGDFFYSVMEHSREHARKRQLGWLPERLPDAWPSMGTPAPPDAAPDQPSRPETAWGQQALDGS